MKKRAHLKNFFCCCFISKDGGVNHHPFFYQIGMSYKLKKEYIGKLLIKGKRRIILQEPIEERTLQMLINEHPKMVEEIKARKPRKKKQDAGTEE